MSKIVIPYVLQSVEKGAAAERDFQLQCTKLVCDTPEEAFETGTVT